MLKDPYQTNLRKMSFNALEKHIKQALRIGQEVWLEIFQLGGEIVGVILLGIQLFCGGGYLFCWICFFLAIFNLYLGKSPSNYYLGYSNVLFFFQAS